MGEHREEREDGGRAAANTRGKDTRRLATRVDSQRKEGREGKGEGEREGEREEKGEGVSGRSHKVWWTEEEIKAHMQEHPDEFAIVMHSPSVALKSYCQSEELPSARNKDALP